MGKERPLSCRHLTFFDGHLTNELLNNLKFLFFAMKQQNYKGNKEPNHLTFFDGHLTNELLNNLKFLFFAMKQQNYKGNKEPNHRLGN